MLYASDFSMTNFTRRRLLKLGLLTPLAISPLYKQSRTLAAPLNSDPEIECIKAPCCTSKTGTRPTNIPNFNSFIWPIAGAPKDPYLIGDAFGPRLLQQAYNWHRGIDIKAAIETEVRASMSGFVRIAADPCDLRYEGCGKMIQLEGTDSSGRRYRTNYCHLAKVGVQLGAIVQQGEIIGLSGDSEANWAHLHFEIREVVPNPNNPGTSLELKQNPYCYLPLPASTMLHKVEIDDLITKANNTINVKLTVSSPREKLDINRINVSILDSNNTEVDSMYVDFNEEHNCGPCSSSTSSSSCVYTEAQNRTVTITPENFWTDIPEWKVNFLFSGLSASNAMQVKVEAQDCSQQSVYDVAAVSNQ